MHEIYRKLPTKERKRMETKISAIGLSDSFREFGNCQTSLYDPSLMIPSLLASIDMNGHCMLDGSYQDCMVLEALNEEEPLPVQTLPPPSP